MELGVVTLCGNSSGELVLLRGTNYDILLTFPSSSLSFFFFLWKGMNNIIFFPTLPLVKASDNITHYFVGGDLYLTLV